MTLPTSTTESNNQAMLAFVPLRLKQPSLLGKMATFVRKTLTIAEWEVRKLRHDPTDLLTRAVQPALWLLVFGETFTHIKAINTGKESYLQFMAPGILAQSILLSLSFTASR
jgi:ABC-2 type transport system permease protein